MSTTFKSLEIQTILAPLGLRFRDAVTGENVGEGLVVTVYPANNQARRASAFANRSGVYVLHRVAGLSDVAGGAGDDNFWNNLSQKKPFTVEVVDERRRYLPFAFSVELPARGVLTWIWPLSETTATPADAGISFGDDFDDGARDEAKWKLGTLNTPVSETFDELVSVVEQDGHLEITPRAGEPGRHYNGYLSGAAWNATDARATVEVLQATEGAAETMFTIAADVDNWYRFTVQAGQILFQTRLGGVESLSSMAYNAAQHRWWRFRHDARDEQVVFETSADAATWTRRRVVPRQMQLTALTIELGAGSGSSVTTPARGVFDNFMLEANPTPAVPLYSAPTRTAPGGMAVLRAELWNPLAQRPAAFAMLEARISGHPTVRGFADLEGRVALVFPYPEPAISTDSQGQPLPAPPYTKQEWSVELRAYYAPPAPASVLPEFPAALKQPLARLWSDEARTTPLTKTTLRFGQERIVRSYTTTTNAPLDPTPLPVLLITPAA